MGATYRRAVEGRFAVPPHFSAAARDLVRRLLQVDLSQRLGCLAGGVGDIKVRRERRKKKRRERETKNKLDLVRDLSRLLHSLPPFNRPTPGSGASTGRPCLPGPPPPDPPPSARPCATRPTPQTLTTTLAWPPRSTPLCCPERSRPCLRTFDKSKEREGGGGGRELGCVWGEREALGVCERPAIHRGREVGGRGGRASSSSLSFAPAARRTLPRHARTHTHAHTHLSWPVPPRAGPWRRRRPRRRRARRVGRPRRGCVFSFLLLARCAFFSGALFPRGPSRAGGRPRPGRTQCRIRVCACPGMHTHTRNATAHPGAPLTSLTAFLSFLSHSHRAPARGSAWAPRPGPPHPRPPHPPPWRRARRVRSWKRCAALWGERERRAMVAGGA